ncbi:MAG: phosphotransferase, partial [Candidatus Angelobacter sp.]
NESGIPVVAKVDDKASVLDELRRFNKFIRPSDNRLRPEVSFHGKTGVILFGLIDQASNQLTPAPTLDSCLRNAWVFEIYQHGKRPQDLVGIIENAISKLEQLNRLRCVAPEFISFAAPVSSALRAAEASGLAFHENRSLQMVRTKAEMTFDKMKICATVHGDIHLRNILVRGSGEAHLVDYALSGPGHPAIDLVRLECCLFTTVFRAFGQEYLLIELQKYLNMPDKTFDSLPDSFVDILHWEINQVAVRGAFACRDAALRVLQHYGGGLADYLAVKCLVGWTGLILLDQQVSSCRAIISAITL